MIDLSRSRIKPYAHQIIGVEALVKWNDASTGRIHGGAFALLDEMGAGKTKQCIDAAQVLFVEGVIDTVIVVAPNSVRDVWYNPELGELKKHLWEGLRAEIIEYRPKLRLWDWGKTSSGINTGRCMRWFITNYELLRSGSWLKDLLPYAGKKTLLVIDEATAVKNWKSQQTEAVYALRKKCIRVIPLNGTPIANNPEDLFALGNMMHYGILETKFITHFRARYAIMGGFEVMPKWAKPKMVNGVLVMPKKIPTEIVGWKDLPELQGRFAPYVLRRLTRDCVDLPPVLPPVTMTCELTPKTWAAYKEMRDDMVLWLNATDASMAGQAIVKSIRLAQITSGYIGGVETMIDDGELPWDESPCVDKVQEIGREKLDLLLEWIKERLYGDPNLKLLVWCRFVPEVARLLSAVGKVYPQFERGCVAGTSCLGSSVRVERENSLRLLDPRTTPPGPVFVAGTYGTGALGLNFTACHTMVNLSYDFSYYKFVQGAARINRPGQVHPISTFDCVATGPSGQKTIDHVIVKARREKEDIANWTTAAWVSAITEE